MRRQYLRIKGKWSTRPKKEGTVFTFDLARAHIRELQRAADDHRRTHPAGAPRRRRLTGRRR
jgi:hypothetical protein